MKILLLGSNGQLGGEILKNLSASSNKFDIFAPSKNELNLINFDQCRDTILNLRPDWIINAAAFTAVEEAENEPLLAKLINSDAPKEIEKSLKKTGGKILHLSTDYVFNGEQDFPWDPYQKTDPQNMYGKTKLLGEKNILNELDSLSKCRILRTSWLIGPSGNNFALKILQLHKSKSFIKVVNDQFGSPTSTIYLAEVCRKIIETDQDEIQSPSIMHWSDYGKTTWYEIALKIGEIAKELGLIDRPSKIIPISSEDYSSRVKRPAYSVLNCKETCNYLGIEQLRWEDNLYAILKSKVN